MNTWTRVVVLLVAAFFIFGIAAPNLVSFEHDLAVYGGIILIIGWIYVAYVLLIQPKIGGNHAEKTDYSTGSDDVTSKRM